MAAEYERILVEYFRQLGYSCHPFKIRWYNATVHDRFRLPYDPDTLAFCIVSTPDMFECAFKPYVELLKQKDGTVVRDPLDQCSQYYFQQASNLFENEEIEFIQDFELHANRRPKILVQTAGHVSGAAYYYQKEDLKEKKFDSSRKIFGASLHPEFGGWFAFRGVMIFKNIKVENLVQKQPIKVLDTDEKVYDFLEKFNTSWKENYFRDVIPVKKSYSKEQRTYFGTFPTSKRLELLGLKMENN